MGGRRWFLLGLSSFAYLYWNGWSFLLLLAVLVISYGGSNLAHRTKTDAARKGWAALSVILILAQLFLFKYLNFAVHIVCPHAPVLDIILPVGISFYTFQAISYVFDTAAKQGKPEKSFAQYALFIVYFPQLVAGPIERSSHLMPQLKTTPMPDKTDIQEGLTTLLIGFFMKLLIADPMAAFVQPVYAAPNTSGGLAVVIATFCFSIQIYCDFAGYSAIALGASRMLGIHLMENFRQPYRAVNIRDFWKRWHISLTLWLTDYVYKPLGGSQNGLLRRCINTLIVFLLSGLWHGANWTFVLWGCLHGCYMVAELVLGKYLPQTVWWRQALTFCLICFAWIFFRAETVTGALALVKNLFAGWSAAQIQADICLLNFDFTVFCSIILRVSALALLPHFPRKAGSDQSYLALFLLVLAVLIGFIAAGQAGGENTFIYFRF